MTLLLMILFNFFFIINAQQDSLQEWYKFAQQFPENPPLKKLEWDNPDYTEFHRSLKIKTRESVLSALQIKKIFWQPQDCLDLISSLAESRKEHITSSNTIARLRISANNEFYLIGTLHGAWHSLLRTLKILKQKKIINDNFEIIKPDTYIVFLGNVIDRGPYSLETLHIAATLLSKNPNNVFYLQGHHEEKNYWYNFGLEQELKIRFDQPTPDKLKKIETSFENFFNTLPLALELQPDFNDDYFIHLGQTSTEDNQKINFNKLNGLFDPNDPNKLKIYNLAHNEKTEPTRNIFAAITEETNIIFRHGTTTALTMRESSLPAPTWFVTSSPIRIYQQYVSFFNDAFVQLIVTNPLFNSTLTSYTHDIRNKKITYKAENIYNLLSGQKIFKRMPIKQEPNLFFGSSLALTKGVYTMGRSIRRGMVTRIQEQNNAGGINGKFIHSIILDDQYVPGIARNNINFLLTQDNINTILLPVGSPTLESYMNLVVDNKIIVIFPVTGGIQFRKPSLTSITHYRPSYADETRALIEHIISNFSAKQFAFFYQDDAYGLGPLKAAHEFLQSKGITKWTDIPYSRTNVDFKQHAELIRQAQPDVIGFFSTGSATQDLIRQLGMDFLLNRKLFGISFLSESKFRKFIAEQGLFIEFAQVVPNPITSDLPIVKKFRKAMDTEGYPYETFSLEAYIATSILIDALKKIEGPITKETIMTALESIKDYDFEGIKLNFNSEHRSLATTVWLETSPDEPWLAIKTVHQNSPE